MDLTIKVHSQRPPKICLGFDLHHNSANLACRGHRPLWRRTCPPQTLRCLGEETKHGRLDRGKPQHRLLRAYAGEGPVGDLAFKASKPTTCADLQGGEVKEGASDTGNHQRANQAVKDGPSESRGPCPDQATSDGPSNSRDLRPDQATFDASSESRDLWPDQATRDASSEGRGPWPDQATEDRHYMNLALKQARQAFEAGEVPVGAVLVSGGVVIAEAFNMTEQSSDPTAHAEILCIRTAARSLGAWRLQDATLYVTLEPCPMCAGALLAARVHALVYGAPSPLLGADGGWIAMLPDQGFPQSDGELNADGPPLLRPVRPHPFHPQLQVRRGVCRKEAAELMRTFFKLRRRQADAAAGSTLT
eukprot:jgi/Botrbrau1/22641/Bobra.176_1s0064.3